MLASPDVVAAGQPSLVSGAGFPAGSQLVVKLFSDPVLLATTIADSLGNYRVAVTIPAGTTPGTHTLVVAPASGTPQAQTAITVTAAAAAAGATTTTTIASLSLTGGNIQGPGLVAIALVLTGLALLVVTWRRRPDIRSFFLRLHR